MLHVLALSVLAVVMRHPELMSYNDHSLSVSPLSPRDGEGPITTLQEDVHRSGAEVTLTLGQIPEKPIGVRSIGNIGNYRKLLNKYQEW